MLVLKSLLAMGVVQLYNGDGKAIAIQVNITVSPLLLSCDIGSVKMMGFTTSIR